MILLSCSNPTVNHNDIISLRAASNCFSATIISPSVVLLLIANCRQVIKTIINNYINKHLGTGGRLILLEHSLLLLNEPEDNSVCLRSQSPNTKSFTMNKAQQSEVSANLYNKLTISQQISKGEKRLVLMSPM